jgi:hypothetical protein
VEESSGVRTDSWGKPPRRWMGRLAKGESGIRTSIDRRFRAQTYRYRLIHRSGAAFKQSCGPSASVVTIRIFCRALSIRLDIPGHGVFHRLVGLHQGCSTLHIVSWFTDLLHNRDYLTPAQTLSLTSRQHGVHRRKDHSHDRQERCRENRSLRNLRMARFRHGRICLLRRHVVWLRYWHNRWCSRVG